MKYRRFQVGVLKFLPGNSQSQFKAIFTAAADHIEPNNGRRFFKSEDGRILLRVEKRNANLYCVLFKSSEYINSYYLDDVNYSEESVEKRAKRGEKVVTAFRFIVIDMKTKERVLYEDVRTPKFTDVHKVLSFKKVSDETLEVIPSLRLSDLSQVPKMYRVEWEYETINNGENERIFKLTNSSKGKLVSLKKRGLFSLSKRNGKYVVVADDDPDANMPLLPCDSDGEYKLFIGHFKDKSGTTTICNLNNLTLRKCVRLKEDEINNHDAVFEKLMNFYLDCGDVLGIIETGE